MLSGKPYAGKLHVRFDEGEGEVHFRIFLSLLYRDKPFAREARRVRRELTTPGSRSVCFPNMNANNDQTFR